MPRFSLLRSTSAIAAIASLTAVAMLIPASASAEPIGSVHQVSTFAPAASFTSCGSASTATNPVSGTTAAVWAAPTAFQSASINITVLGAGAVPGTTVTYQPADATPVSDPSGSCNPISVDAGANGGFLISWTTDDAIFGLVVDSSGAVVGTEFALSSNLDYGDIETVTAAWSAVDSRYLVSWKASVSSPFPAALDSQQIVGRFVSGAGVPLGTDFLITDIAEGIDNSQDIAYGAGTWVATGVAMDAGNDRVRAVAITPAGVVAPAVIVPAPAGSSTGASIDFNVATGQFFIVSRSGSTVWGQFISPTGALVGAPYTVATSNGSRPRLASIGASGWLVVWHIPGGPGGGTDVLGIEVSAAGASVGTASVLSGGFNNTAVESNFRPEVAFSATTSEATVVWSRFLTAPGETNVVARAWAVPRPVAAVAQPTLPLTGVDSDRAAIALGAGVLALIAGALALAARRRRGVSIPA